MHEMSLVKSLWAQASSIMAEHGAVAIAEVVIELGPLSGVEPVLVQSAFESLMDACGERETTLVIREVPLVIRCRECDCESPLVNFEFRCSSCGSGNVQVIQGDEFRLLTVTLRGCPSHV